MSNADTPAPAEEIGAPPGGIPLGDRAARGFVWLLGQSVLLRLVTLGGQFVLAYLLTTEDFGDVGLALTVHAFASIVQQGGISEILIKRRAHFGDWSNPAFWMSLVLGVLAGAAVAGGAPLAEWAYGQGDLAPLLRVLAVSMVPAALIMVPEAKLSAELRFRTLAVVGVMSAGAQVVLAVVFAALGLGALSMVLPRPMVLTVHWVVVMLLARPRVSRRPQVRLWKHLIGDHITVLLGKVCLVATHQGDYIVLGVLTSDHVVGVYYFAFGLSMQTMTLITTNLGSVLFPVLSHVNDPRKQTRDFLRAARLLALVGIPLCLLQAGLADPLIRALFPNKWEESIPILQILSLGMALRLVGSPAGSLFNAQGRFGTVLILNACYAVVFLGAVTIGAFLNAGIGVAIGASIYFALLGPVHMYIAIRPGGGGWGDVSRVYTIPLLSSLAALVPSVWLAEQVPPFPGRDWVRTALITAVTGVSYTLLIRMFVGELLRELFQRCRGVPVIGRVGAWATVLLRVRAADEKKLT